MAICPKCKSVIDMKYYEKTGKCAECGKQIELSTSQSNANARKAAKTTYRTLKPGGQTSYKKVNKEIPERQKEEKKKPEPKKQVIEEPLPFDDDGFVTEDNVATDDASDKEHNNYGESSNSKNDYYDEDDAPDMDIEEPDFESMEEGNEPENNDYDEDDEDEQDDEDDEEIEFVDDEDDDGDEQSNDEEEQKAPEPRKKISREELTANFLQKQRAKLKETQKDKSVHDEHVNSSKGEQKKEKTKKTKDVFTKNTKDEKQPDAKQKETEDKKKSPALWLKSQKESQGHAEQMEKEGDEYVSNKDGYYDDTTPQVPAKADLIPAKAIFKIIGVAAGVFGLLAFMIYYV